MKKKLIILIIVTILISIGGVLLYFIHCNSVEKEIRNKKVIVESSCSKMYGNYYEGILICDDGSIYSFNFDDNFPKRMKNSLTETEQYVKIMKNAKLKSSGLSNDDLKKLKEYSSQIIPQFADEDTGMELDWYNPQVSSTKIYRYETDDFVTLWEGGAARFIKKNTSEKAPELLDIINKYLAVE